MIRSLVERVMVRALRRTFRRIVWTSEPLVPEATRPVVLYANHQYHHDGYILWYLLRELGRRATTWMQEWDRFPIFTAVGARPFPSDDPSRRAATVRATAEAFRQHPSLGLIYFPEGRLHGSDEPVLDFPPEAPIRLHRLLGEPLWIPIGIRVVWGHEARPTVLMGGGPVHDQPDGRERERLCDILANLPSSPDADGDTLLHGRIGPDERLSFQFLKPFFARHL